MPWAADDAERHTKKADTAKRQRMWSEIANSVLTDTGDEGRAIREANAAVAKDYAKSNNTVRAFRQPRTGLQLISRVDSVFILL